MTHTDDALTDAVAKALYDFEPDDSGSPCWTWEKAVQIDATAVGYFRDMARAAITAVRQHDADQEDTDDGKVNGFVREYNRGYRAALDEHAAPGEGVDELLDSVNPETHVTHIIYVPQWEEWAIGIGWPRTDGVEHPQPRAYGTGPTRMDAIRNAVAQATTMQEGARR